MGKTFKDRNKFTEKNLGKKIDTKKRIKREKNYKVDWQEILEEENEINQEHLTNEEDYDGIA